MKIYSSIQCDSGCKKAQEGVPYESTTSKNRKMHFRTDKKEEESKTKPLKHTDGSASGM